MNLVCAGKPRTYQARVFGQIQFLIDKPNIVLFSGPQSRKFYYVCKGRSYHLGYRFITTTQKVDTASDVFAHRQLIMSSTGSSPRLV